MPGYTGFHKTAKSSWSVTTIAAVVVVHIVFIAAVYRLSQTEYVQHLIKVSKLVTVQEPVKPPNQPPPSEKEPEAKPEPLIERKPDPPPVVKEPITDPVVEEAPVEDTSSPPTSVGDQSDQAPAGPTTFAIGKGRSRFALYEDLLMGAIQAAYRQPPELPDSLEYAVLCQLVVDEQGYVLAYELLNSSGNAVFDRSAQQALSRLRQVRPPPEGMSRTIVVKFYPP